MQEKLQFKAYDHVNFNYFYSKDYESLTEFFARFDNVQYTITPDGERNPEQQIRNILLHIKNNYKSLNEVTEYIDSMLEEIEIYDKYGHRVNSDKWVELTEGVNLMKQFNDNKK